MEGDDHLQRGERRRGQPDRPPSWTPFWTGILLTGKAEGEYTFAVEDSEDLQSAAAEAAADAAAKWDVKAKNGSISEYDAATDKFLFADGAPGKAVNQEKLIKDLVEAATSGNYDAVIQAEVNESQPELSAANAKEQYKTLSTFTTETTANEKRNTNVKLAARAINGTIVRPGEEFSFNKVVGQRTAEKGYQEAGCLQWRRGRTGTGRWCMPGIFDDVPCGIPVRYADHVPKIPYL